MAKYLITGGAGFLGKFVSRELIARGISEKDLVILRSKDCDLTRQDQVDRMMAEVKPEVVIHLAARVGGIGANRENPGLYFYANMTMGVNLIEAARVNKIRKFVQVGTICAYPKFTPVPFHEENLWDGYPEETNAPYGVAKKALLVMCQSYRQQYDLNAIYLLPVNLYGPGDNFDLKSSHVIPALIRKVVEAQNAGADYISAWGTGSVSREFLYVEDAARGIVEAMFKYNEPEPVNIGAGREITIRDLTELICKLCGFKGRIEWDPTKPDGQPRRCLDTSRAKEKFGFVAQTSLEDGLKKTIEWYRGAVNHAGNR
ncbi:MAG TPA: GDP-L-fucose synthase [Phycisphaerae bacterium]|nr:GDP-L-fucose synthase [Phycisphaerae bacterium]